MAIVNLPLPNQIADGQVADAVPLMANFNYIAAQVNANVVSNSFSAAILDTGYGYQALNLGLGINANTAVGYQSLAANILVGTGSNGQNNSGFGYKALAANTSGGLVTAVGALALAANTSGNNNTAVGYTALAANTTGTNNTAVGTSALASNVSAIKTTAVGSGALGLCTAGPNTAIGYNAGESLTSGTGNVFIGDSAGLAGGTASNNTIVGSNIMSGGSSAGAGNVGVGAGIFTSISFASTLNVAVGITALQQLASGTNNTGLGAGALSGNTTFSDCSGLGSAAAVTGSSQVQLGDAATSTFAYGAVQNRSDARDKADVRDTVMGLSFINSLRPVDYKWDMREDYRTDPAVPLHAITHDGSKKRGRYHHGFIAQEVHAAALGQFGGVQHHAIKGGHDVWSIGEGELIACLTKAVQELSAEITALKEKK